MTLLLLKDEGVLKKKKVEWGQHSSFAPVQEVLGRSQVILPKAAMFHRLKKCPY